VRKAHIAAFISFECFRLSRNITTLRTRFVIAAINVINAEKQAGYQHLHKILHALKCKELYYIDKHYYKELQHFKIVFQMRNIQEYLS
jgi:hypothetical protein